MIGMFTARCIFSDLLNMIPFFGYAISKFFLIIDLVFSIVFGTALSVIVMAVAWFFSRPLIALVAIIIVVGITVGLTLA